MQGLSVNKKRKPRSKMVNAGGQSVPSEAEDEDDKTASSEPSSEPSIPSIWKAGGAKSTKTSTLCVPTASVLMGLLYGARMARYDLLRPVQSLATFLHEWDAECDDRLYRLVSYINSTLHLRQMVWVGDESSELGPHLYADADFAGCPRPL